MKQTTILAAALLVTSLFGCSDKDAEELYKTAQFEERQNNVQHAKDLYQEITTKYPSSDYAKDAQARLTILSQVTPKQE
jgi:outer membrane protein assembly factor BamD (BamD/ComL family)